MDFRQRAIKRKGLCQGDMALLVLELSDWGTCFQVILDTIGLSFITAVKLAFQATLKSLPQLPLLGVHPYP